MPPTDSFAWSQSSSYIRSAFTHFFFIVKSLRLFWGGWRILGNRAEQSNTTVSVVHDVSCSAVIKGKQIRGHRAEQSARGATQNIPAGRPSGHVPGVTHFRSLS